MSKVLDGWRDYRDRSSIQTFGAAPREALPELSALLEGKANAQGTGWERPPLSLRLYLDGDLVRFCFSSLEFPMQLWGSVKSLDAGLLAVEEALCRENCDWRKNHSYANGFTQHRK